jgi:hypothetical protein
MKITQKMVKEVKAHTKQTHHDDAWWDFEKLETTTTIQTTIHFCGVGASVKEITEEANRRGHV